MPPSILRDCFTVVPYRKFFEDHSTHQATKANASSSNHPSRRANDANAVILKYIDGMRDWELLRPLVVIVVLSPLCAGVLSRELRRLSLKDVLHVR